MPLVRSPHSRIPRSQSLRAKPRNSSLLYVLRAPGYYYAFFCSHVHAMLRRDARCPGAVSLIQATRRHGRTFPLPLYPRPNVPRKLPLLQFVNLSLSFFFSLPLLISRYISHFAYCIAQCVLCKIAMRKKKKKKKQETSSLSPLHSPLGHRERDA